MSAVLEQTPEEIDFLVGAKITQIEKAAAENVYDIDSLELTLELRYPIQDQDGTSGKTVKLQVWQDPEGNGPGYLALTGVAP